MTLKYELLIIALLVALTLVLAHALENGTFDLAGLQQLIPSRG
jgi:hypothetical protein